MRTDPDDDTGAGDDRPQAEHGTPIHKTAETGARAPFRLGLAFLTGCRASLARTGLARGIVLVVIDGTAFRRAPLRLDVFVILRTADAIPWIEATPSSDAAPSNFGSLRPLFFLRPNAIQARADML